VSIPYVENTKKGEFKQDKRCERRRGVYDLYRGVDGKNQTTREGGYVDKEKQKPHFVRKEGNRESGTVRW